MKKIVLLWFLSTCSVTFGTVIAPEVFMPDSNLPMEYVDCNDTFIYPDIMVGSELSVIIKSQTTEFGWIGTLTMSNDDLNISFLTGRGFDGISYKDSCLQAAGDYAEVWDWTDVNEQGLYFCTGYPAVPGDWFVFDYFATDTGTCILKLTEHCPPPVEDTILIKKLQFNHVASRDFNADGIVNYKDFPFFALHWGKKDFDEPYAYDINDDNSIDVKDLKLLADFWLVRTKH